MAAPLRLRPSLRLRPRPAAAAVAAAALAVSLAGCGQTSKLMPLPTTTVAAVPTPSGSAAAGATPSSGSSTTSPPATAVSGLADVAYAGSLQYLNEKVIGPAFEKATGARYQGTGAGSLALSKEILAGEITPGVFESIGAAPITALAPKYTSWYAQVAASPIVVAYNPTSRYAPQLAAIAKGTKPLSDLFTLMATPGFTLGRTDPNTDPQGQAFYEMVELAQSSLHLPTTTVGKVLGALDNPSQIFAETALEARLQSGQLDAASAFLSQAVQLHLPYITLPSSIDFGSPSLAAQYAKATVTLTNGTVVHGSPLVVDITTIGKLTPAAEAFVAYVLSPPGRQEMQAGGYQLLPETIGGNTAAVPTPIQQLVAGSAGSSGAAGSAGSAG